MATAVSQNAFETHALCSASQKSPQLSARLEERRKKQSFIIKNFSHSQVALFPRVKRIYVLFALHNKLETTDRKIIIGIQNQMLAILGRW